jgi:hypothetical protein
MQALSWSGALIFLLSSCSAKWHHAQACKKDSTYCATEVRIDTFTVRDTWLYYRVDTLSEYDTITIDTGGIYFRIIRDHDIIRTTIKQKPDTTYFTIYKKVAPKVITKYKYPWWLLLLIPFTLWLILKK